MFWSHEGADAFSFQKELSMYTLLLVRKFREAQTIERLGWDTLCPKEAFNDVQTQAVHMLDLGELRLLTCEVSG